MRAFFLLTQSMGIVRRSISPHAAPMRRHATDAETVLWLELRNRRLQGHKFKRQWTLGSYIVDFCCREQRLIIEVDGGQHSEERDRHRTAWLEKQGYRILRFWNHEVLGNMDGVLQTICQVLTPHPHPGPLPQAGEGEI